MRFMYLQNTVAALVLSAGLVWAQAPPPAEAQQRALHAVTTFAQGYTERLPDFTCIRTTVHYFAPATTKNWREEARTAYELSYYGRDEHYKLLTVNDVPVKKVPSKSKSQGWIEMSGNFGGILKQLFDPKVHPHFEWSGWDLAQGKRAMVFSYRIALAESRAVQSSCGNWLVFSTCKERNYAFHGMLFIDAESLDILRIAATPDDLPTTFALGEEAVDYARIIVAGNEYLLPVADRIETWNGKTLFRNDSTYADYKKFVAESTLIP
jgi:hypothetical protein